MEHPLTDAWRLRQEQAMAAVCAWRPDLGQSVPEAFESLLTFQRTWEEQVLFPRLARYFVGGGPVPVMTAEHRELEALWGEIQANGDLGSRETARDNLAHRLQLHCKKESLSLQTVARIRLSRREFEQLLEQGRLLGLSLEGVVP
jgi:hypothetical protein